MDKSIGINIHEGFEQKITLVIVLQVSLTMCVCGVLRVQF